jgi:HrpA-like RNA helicase
MFTEYFGKCPIIEIEQRLYEVQHFFIEDGRYYYQQ